MGVFVTRILEGAVLVGHHEGRRGTEPKEVGNDARAVVGLHATRTERQGYDEHQAKQRFPKCHRFLRLRNPRGANFGRLSYHSRVQNIISRRQLSTLCGRLDVEKLSWMLKSSCPLLRQNMYRPVSWIDRMLCE